MKSDVYAVPAADVSAVKREMEAKAQSRAASTEEAQKANQLYQAKVARSRAETPTPAAAGNRLASMIKGDLVTSRNGTLQTYNDQALDGKKLLGLYFSAKWCPTCRKFTPQLVEYYNRVVAKHPEFEIIFVSNDRSAPAMESYMRDAQMPWPAVKFEKIADKQVLTRYAGSGIPCLVIVDAQGRIVSDSYDGKTYRGPEKVLADLDQFFARGSAPEVAQGR